MSNSSSPDDRSAADSAETESAADVHVAYQKTKSVDRRNWYGRTMRWIGERPFSAGLAGGVAVVLIAALAAPRGIAAAPFQAGILSLMVIAIWAVLFYFMRDFFEEQGRREVAEDYEIEADPEHFQFQRNGEALVRLEGATYELRRPPHVEVPQHQPGAATRVWLVVSGEEEQAPFILETKVTAGEASQYPEAPEGLTPDETLPIHVASSLLQLGERAES